MPFVGTAFHRIPLLLSKPSSFTSTTVTNKAIMSTNSGKIMQIAIDGPAASGKSTTASMLARHLNFAYIDSGAIYRALTWKALKEGIDPECPENMPKILTLLQSLKFTYRIDEKVMTMTDSDGKSIEKKRPVFVVIMDGQEAPDAEIRTPIISQKVSKVAKVPEFRKIIVEAQRLFASQLPENADGSTRRQDAEYIGGVVMDGRDIGSVVLKDAPIKIFLVADPLVRAQRRLDEILSKPGGGQEASTNEACIDREAILQAMIQRDQEDETRQASPLIQLPQSICLDSTKLDLDARVAFITDLVKKLWPSVLDK